jgi:hypothetical protein
MAESAEERGKRLKAQRQARWRLRRKLGEQLPQSEPGTVLVPGEPTGGDAGPWPGPGNGLPVHMGADPFGALLDVGVRSLGEAERYTRYVEGLSPEQALTPLRPGASPPAAEARLQRAEARAVLMQMAATPVTAIRVMRDASGAFDLAAEALAIAERRSERFPGAYRDDRTGEFVIPVDVEDGEDT